MRLMRAGRRTLVLGLALGACLALPRPGPTPAVRALASAPSPASLAVEAVTASCKPIPPILIRFVDGPAPGPAVLHLEALEPVTDVVVSIWTQGRAGAGLPQQVWRGGLARGESRLLRVAPSLPEGAAELWAAAEVQHEPEAMIRSLASVPLATRGSELTSEPGRLLVSQPTGERVLEFTGSRAVAR